MTKAYDMENLQHNDCTYSECIRLIKNGISEKFLEPKNIKWIDSDGYTCSTWRIGYKEKEEDKAGMSLEEAKAYIEKLKAKIDDLTRQVEHYKMLAEERNKYIIVTEVDPYTNTIDEFYIDADSVKCSWRMIRKLRERLYNLQYD